MKRPKAPEEEAHVIAQFVSAEGLKAGAQLDLPLDFDEQQLQELLNEVLSNEEPLPYSFFVRGDEVVGNLKEFMAKRQLSSETTLEIVYQPQAVFRVRALTRCTSTLPGHTDAVLSVSFSPDGTLLASGSGDKTLRIWDLLTQTPTTTCSGHTHWVLCIGWSPDGKQIASGSHDTTICLWNPHAADEATRSKPRIVLRGHKKFVTALSWQPMHRTYGRGCRKLVSASKDGTAKIWDTVSGHCVQTLCGHAQSVTAVRWGGEGLIYTASQDTTINVWSVDEESGSYATKMIRQLKDHGHWINTLALSNDHLLRSGPFDHTTDSDSFDTVEAFEASKKRYETENGSRPELLVSGSDDFTMYLWNPSVTHKPVARLMGHQQLINSVAFSPDGAYIASGSFDKSVRIWNGRDGKFVCTFRGHVGAVYGVVWSSDGRMVLSASKDSTVKLWSMRTRRMEEDLPGHADEVFAVDWAPDGAYAASGGKDRVLKIWHH